MIKVTFGTNLKRTTSLVDPQTTLRSALETAEIDYSCGMLTLDGAALNPGDLDKTFASFGVTDKCFLLSVAKTENA